MNPRALILGYGLGIALLSCDRPPVVRNCDPDAAVHCPNLNDPAGRIEGTLIYKGPVPAAGPDGQAPGRVILLLFPFNNPPPPDGTSTTAVSFQSISASQLFQNANVQPDGSVLASVPFTFPNIPAAGEYQLRAFYSHATSASYIQSNSTRTLVTGESGFQPLFSVRNQPVEGDVGGGAIEDSSAAIPRFSKIIIGTQSGTDANGNPTYVLPVEGFVRTNVQVFLGKVFNTTRPMFHAVINSSAPLGVFTQNAVAAPPGAVDPVTHVPMPSPALLQYARDTGLLPAGSPQLDLPRNYPVQHGDTGEDLPQFTITSSFLTDPASAMVDECAIAAAAGVQCPGDPMRSIGFVETAYDRNQNGTIDLTATATPPFADAHPTLVTTSTLASRTMGHLPWVYPLVILTKLHEPTPLEQALLSQGQNGMLTATQYAQLRQSLNQPEALDAANGRYPVLLLGSILPGGVAANLLLGRWDRAGGFSSFEPTVRIGIVPIAIEVHGPNPATDWWAILPPATPEVLAATTRFLPSHYRCWDFSNDPTYTPDFPFQAGVPYGRYSINVINSNGQVWTVPNELTNVGGASAPCAAPDSCHALSQGLVVRLRDALPYAGVDLRCPNPPECPDPANPANPLCH